MKPKKYVRNTRHRISEIRAEFYEARDACRQLATVLDEVVQLGRQLPDLDELRERIALARQLSRALTQAT
jgi:hypothetical protein